VNVSAYILTVHMSGPERNFWCGFWPSFLKNNLICFAEELTFQILHTQMDTLSHAHLLILNTGQSTPIAGAANKITVTLQTNVEVSGNERQNITLSGLSKAIADSELKLQDVPDSYGLFQFFE
jgi:hypothetical protein